MEDPSSIQTAGGLLAVVLLVFANGFFVAAEFSLVAVRRSRINQLVAEGHRRARAVQWAVHHLYGCLAASQLGITMSSLALGWIGEPVLARLVEPLFGFLPQDMASYGAHTISVVIAFAFITSLHIVVGEQAPKTLALRRSEATALIVAPPLELYFRIFRPVIYLLNGLGNLMVRPFGLRPVDGEEEAARSVEELRLLVSASRQAGVLSEGAEEIVERVFAFDDFSARQVMVPRVDMVSVPVSASPREALKNAIKHHHTRLPVYEGDLDNVVGVVHLADLVAVLEEGEPEDLRQVMGPVLVVPESMPADRLLTRMRAERAQMVVLVDEYGGTAGLVTIHDLMERLVGPVLDVREVADDTIELLPDGGAILGGLALVHDVNERFGLELDEEETDTIGGFVVARLGRLPVPGEEVAIGGYLLRVEGLVGRRFDKLRLTKRDEQPEAGASGRNEG
ncbi:MAG: hemolysin family protein [Dehalococcoidia bacterium]|nr:hemolysin family protein [Dehalococcoidia bacterium]